MPFYRRKRYSPRRKTYRRKRTYYRRRRAYRRKPRIYQGPVPMARTVTLKYVQAVQLDSASGALSYQYFRANSIYDPDYTGVGHQPLGYDQWAVFYKYYTVTSSYMRARGAPTFPSGTTTYPIVAGIYLDDDTSGSPGQWEALLEQGRCSGAVANDNPSGNSWIKLTKGYSARKWFRTGNPVGDDRQTADFGANPTDSVHFMLWQSSVGSENTRPWDWVVEIWFTCKLTEPLTVDQS